MVTLAIESTTGSDLTYQLTKPVIVIGASGDNDVVLRAPGVAPRHLVIQRNGDVYTFLAQSRQVVVLNGERRSRGVLRVGDRGRTFDDGLTRFMAFAARKQNSAARFFADHGCSPV